jgi:demethylmenaquinone methyltransferase/2-methoxy-6-polyprenyl-1,4-benzoquinol methylase
MSAGSDLEALLAEQVAYYRARAPEYSETAIPELPVGELARARDAAIAALDAFRPEGDVLELACGPGTWTPELLRRAHTVTALDAAPEMLRLARTKVSDPRARFLQANVFDWKPDQRYDIVFFGFWLSHVPLERFADFWSRVDRGLKPNGRVAFVDDAYRTPDELIEGQRSAVIRRELNNGTRYRAIKVPHRPAELEQRLKALGWAIQVRDLEGPFFWGSGGRARSGKRPG